MSYTAVESCRSCGSADLRTVLDLGAQPLANSFPPLTDTSPTPRYPLVAVRCGACALVQLAGTVPPGEMFDDYLYFSSYSDGMTRSAQALATSLAERRRLGPADLVVEVASNDGYLLKHYQSRRVRVLGVEPAANVAAVAEAAGVPTTVAYLTETLARRIVAESGPAAVVHANNVLAHVPDINDFVAALAALLTPGGVLVVETPWVVQMVDRCEFDTVYHEHVFYYSLTALEALFQRHGLHVVDLEQLELHGGSLRLFVALDNSTPGPSVSAVREQERALGVDGDAYYQGFADRVASVKAATLALLHDWRGRGARIAGYGAAAKGTVLLNHFGIDRDLLAYVVDRNHHKHGRRMPGTAVPIEPTDRLREDRPELVLLMAWNFAEEILAQQADYRSSGGKFLIPVPTPQII